MPKAKSKRQTTRPAPYNLRTAAANMTAVMQSPMNWGQPPQPDYSWSGPQYSAYQQMTHSLPQSMPTSYMSMPTPAHQQATHTRQPSQSVPWTDAEDEILIEAKSKGQGWKEIANYFPGKSDNACRKRHERITFKRKADKNWDDARRKRAFQAYTDSTIRERFWREVAKKIGEESWEDVEEVVCRRSRLAQHKTWH
jgi:hypothetical protein